MIPAGDVFLVFFKEHPSVSWSCHRQVLYFSFGELIAVHGNGAWEGVCPLSCSVRPVTKKTIASCLTNGNNPLIYSPHPPPPTPAASTAEPPSRLWPERWAQEAGLSTGSPRLDPLGCLCCLPPREAPAPLWSVHRVDLLLTPPHCASLRVSFQVIPGPLALLY